jgi:hypothetical protein
MVVVNQGRGPEAPIEVRPQHTSALENALLRRSGQRAEASVPRDQILGIDGGAARHRTAMQPLDHG